MNHRDHVPISLPEAITRAAQEHPDTPLLSDSPWSPTGSSVANHRDLDAFVDSFADRLWAAGLRPGDRVAIVKRDHIDVLAMAAGVMRMGGVPALLSWRMQPSEILACLRRLEGPALVLDDTAAQRLGEVRDDLRETSPRTLGIGDDPPDWLHPLGDRAAHEPYHRDLDELTIITHTSGTTGVPKLVAHSVATFYQLGAPTLPFGRQLDDHNFSLKCLSWTHVRTASALQVVLILDVPLIALSDPRPEHVKELMLRYRPTAVEAHPNLLLRWEPLAADPDKPLASVSRYITTFDAMHPRTVRTLLDASDQPVALHMQGYGQSETGPILLRFVARGDVDDVPGRDVGRPIEGHTEVRIVDENGEPVPLGTTGQIEARSLSMMLGYVGTDIMPERGSWWPTGDLGRMLPDGSVELFDRVVDSADRFESLLKLEDTLLDSLPELDEVVFVKPSPSEVAAVVCVQAGRTLDRAGWETVAAQLDIQDIPVHEWRWEDLPLTGSWKVRRHLLAEMVRERRAPAVAP